MTLLCTFCLPTKCASTQIERPMRSIFSSWRLVLRIPQGWHCNYAQIITQPVPLGPGMVLSLQSPSRSRSLPSGSQGTPRPLDRQTEVAAGTREFQRRPGTWRMDAKNERDHAPPVWALAYGVNYAKVRSTVQKGRRYDNGSLLFSVPRAQRQEARYVRVGTKYMHGSSRVARRLEI